MRIAACAGTLLLAAGLIGQALAQPQPLPRSAPLTTGSVPAPKAADASTGCANPAALGVARTVEIDTTGGPGFGFEHFKQHDFLREGEVVLTLDDGPWPNNTPAVLRALAAQCTKATFFAIGKHSMWHPEILRQVAAEGHTVGTHTWSHMALSKKPADVAKEEIEKGFSAVRWALGGTPPSPFFRFPTLAHPPEMVTYLGERNISMFSTDMDSFDFKLKKPELVIKSVMDKLKKHGKGIVLMHDFQRVTAEAMPELLNQMKAAGYKMVHLKAKGPVETLAEYDAMVVKDQKLPTVSARPTTSVVRTIGE
jgi:peptidoglycan/xylan/chitin deacetylase (PgdA/CDA1 family)